jgi:hypothetical protein
MVLGRMKTRFPSDGELDNVEQMELYFPNRYDKSEVLHIQRDEISRRSRIQTRSNFVQVRILASAKE